ncbi:hypothetical protein [Nocardia rhizosphaerae]|uniref:Tripartite tricarboxylate transporter TctB family protein n=1 Tax=Nocardia rhizosphaerae TaxID=1691571 RepID=A0ABV8LC42_9NOCA
MRRPGQATRWREALPDDSRSWKSATLGCAALFVVEFCGFLALWNVLGFDRVTSAMAITAGVSLLVALVLILARRQPRPRTLATGGSATSPVVAHRDGDGPAMVNHAINSPRRSRSDWFGPWSPTTLTAALLVYLILFLLPYLLALWLVLCPLQLIAGTVLCALGGIRRHVGTGLLLAVPTALATLIAATALLPSP